MAEEDVFFGRCKKATHLVVTECVAWFRGALRVGISLRHTNESASDAV